MLGCAMQTIAYLQGCVSLASSMSSPTLEGHWINTVATACADIPCRLEEGARLKAQDV